MGDGYPDDCNAFGKAGLDGSFYKDSLSTYENAGVQHWRKPVCGIVQTSIPK
jgi:hypothetical protein